MLVYRCGASGSKMCRAVPSALVWVGPKFLMVSSSFILNGTFQNLVQNLIIAIFFIFFLIGDSCSLHIFQNYFFGRCVVNYIFS